MIDGPVVQVEHVPQSHVAEKTVEIPQLDVFENTPVLPVVEELAEASKAFSQNRVQQSSMEQTVANPAISLAEKTVDVPVTRTQEKTQHVVNTHVQHVANVVEAEMPKIIKETQQRKKPIIKEKIYQVTKHVEIPQLQIVEKTTETSKMQTIQGTQTFESLGTAPVCQVTQARHVEVKSRTRSRDYDTGRTAGIHEDMSADRPKAQMSTSIVQELKSKFEAKQKGSQVPTVQRVQKTVEVARVQYIDKVVGQNRERVSDYPMLRPGRRAHADGHGRDRRARPRTRDNPSDRMGPRLARREERADASPRTCWNSGPQRKMR